MPPSPATPSPATPYPLTALTIVLGPPTAASDAFDDFQAQAGAGARVAEHPWAQHEYAALDALTRRERTIASHSLLETYLGSVLQVGVIAADVERQWVRHEDGRLYVSLTVYSEDVRPRAAGQALHDPVLVEALQAVGTTLAALDARAWIRWSSRTEWTVEAPDALSRCAALVGRIAELVITESPLGEATDDEARALEPELLTAIRLGRAHADAVGAEITRDLRALRHHEPMRAEWGRVLMDAFFLGALDTAQLAARRTDEATAGLAYLYLGRERVERLKANPVLSPRFRGEIAAKTFMTAYALERLAPLVSAALEAELSAASRAQ